MISSRSRHLSPVVAVSAEENAGLNNGQFEWAFGNGSTSTSVQPDLGLVMPSDYEVIALSLGARTPGAGNTEINLHVNGGNVGLSLILAGGTPKGFAHVSYFGIVGDSLNFLTITAGGMSVAVATMFIRIRGLQ